MMNHMRVTNILDGRITESEHAKYGIARPIPTKMLEVQNSENYDHGYVSLVIDSEQPINGHAVSIEVRAEDLIKAVQNAMNY